MRKLLIAVILLLALAFFARNSPHYSVLRLQQGLEQGDLNVVMRYADLGRFAELPVELSVAMAAAGMKEAAGGLGEALANAFGTAIGAAVKQVGGQVATQELRSRIEKRDLIRLLGGFRPNEGLSWYGGIESIGGDAAILTVVGTCDSRESKGERIGSRLGIELIKVRGALLGLPYDWRANGVEANSLRGLVRDCVLKF
ncbi:MAG: hypothetical protein JNJ54_27305 [Myxococcaceae bacterium]|nr:hypothetical protein [Myxococcaceae bacterium]